MAGMELLPELATVKGTEIPHIPSLLRLPVSTVDLVIWADRVLDYPGGTMKTGCIGILLLVASANVAESQTPTEPDVDELRQIICGSTDESPQILHQAENCKQEGEVPPKLAKIICCVARTVEGNRSLRGCILRIGANRRFEKIVANGTIEAEDGILQILQLWKRHTHHQDVVLVYSYGGRVLLAAARLGWMKPDYVIFYRK